MTAHEPQGALNIAWPVMVCQSIDPLIFSCARTAHQLQRSRSAAGAHLLLFGTGFALALGDDAPAGLGESGVERDVGGRQNRLQQLVNLSRRRRTMSKP